MTNFTVDDWMKEVGNIYGSFEVRENVNDLHSYLGPAMEMLKTIEPYCSSHLTVEIHKLLTYYDTMKKICVEMSDRMELPEVNLSQTNLASSDSDTNTNKKESPKCNKTSNIESGGVGTETKKKSSKSARKSASKEKKNS
ncbi:unnamed protein product [Caenorhabditis bovis]|uniref:Uncharacterized protein n=1 Tax=Caenorhabditis bovis TaxID=2654633 RepID=A0A8S1EFP2_9PELO|nr:unnamed protein product [Caenorhabditis bovis]